MANWISVPPNKSGTISITGLNTGRSHKFQLKLINANGETISQPYYKTTGASSTAGTTISPNQVNANLTKVLTRTPDDPAYLENSNSTIWSGVAVTGNTLRGYYHNRTTKDNFFIETTDMQNWSDPVKINLPTTGTNRLRVFYYNG